MNKKQREAAEVNLLKSMIKDKPKYKEFLDAMIDNENPELEDAIKPVLTEQFKKERMIGIEIGWMACLRSMAAKIKDYGTVQEAVDKINAEAKDRSDKLGLKFEV